MNYNENYKSQLITLINAQYMLRFANKPWYFEEKLLSENASSEEVKYTLKTIDSEGMELIQKYFK